MPPRDTFLLTNADKTAPADIHFAIAPSDSTDLTILPRALYILTSGNVALQDAAGTNVTYAVTAGDILPFRPTRVLSTGTTATMVGWS